MEGTSPAREIAPVGQFETRNQRDPPPADPGIKEKPQQAARRVHVLVRPFLLSLHPHCSELSKRICLAYSATLAKAHTADSGDG